MSSEIGVRLVGLATRGGGRLALAGALALSAVPAAASSGQRAPRDGRVAGGPQGAHRTAELLLRRVVLPAGAVPGGSSSEATPVLHGPGSQPPAPNLLDVHGYWHVPGEPHTVADWLHGHPPASATIKGGGAAGTGDAPNMWWVRYAFRAPRDRFRSEELVLALVRANGGGTLLRADAQVVWIPRHTRARQPSRNSTIEAAKRGSVSALM